MAATNYKVFFDYLQIVRAGACTKIPKWDNIPTINYGFKGIKK